MFKLPTSFHSSMVRDFPDFFYGDRADTTRRSPIRTRA